MIGYARSEANGRGQGFRNPNHGNSGWTSQITVTPRKRLRTTAPALALIPLPENCRIGVAWSFIEERTLWDGLVKETAKYSVFAGCSWLLSDHRLVAKAGVFRGKCRQPDCSWPGLSAKTASSTRRGGSHLARGNVQFRLDGRRASFEASLREAPQDEENFLMPSRTSLMLRRRAAPSRSAPGVDATSN